MTVIGPVHSSRMFTWDPITKTGSAEISDFSGEKVWDRLFDDACDIGFQIYSKRTGKRVPFYLAFEDTRDGELIAWTFFPYRCQELANWKIVIFND